MTFVASRAMAMFESVESAWGREAAVRDVAVKTCPPAVRTPLIEDLEMSLPLNLNPKP